MESGRSPKNFCVWRLPVHCEHELSLAQMKISVAHRNYGLKWFNAAAAAASATPIRLETVHCVVFFSTFSICVPCLGIICVREHPMVWLCESVSQLNRFETNRSTSTTIQTISVCFFRPDSRIPLQPHLFGLNFFLSPSLTLFLSDRVSFVFQCAGQCRRRGC